MRTDVKVGVAVGLLLVIGVVTYYAIFDRGNQGGPDSATPAVAAKGGDASAKPAAAKPDAPAKTEEVILPRFGGLARTPATPTISGARATPPAPTTPVTPAVAAIPSTPIPSTPAPSSPEPTVTPSVAVRPATPERAPTPGITDVAAPVAAAATAEPPVTPSMTEPAPAPEPVAPRIRETPIVPSGPSVAPRIRETPASPEGPITPTIRETPGRATPGVTPGVTPAAGTETIYEVKKGDSGFWKIAEKVYGDGKYWTLIAQANPGVQSSSLTPGKKLKIPAKPAPKAVEPGRETPGGVVTPAGVTPAGVTPGGVAAGGNGKSKSEYVVKQGDAGFWGISKTVYGDGKYWAMIAKANPKVSSSGMKAGDKLVIPPKPESATTRPAAGTGTIDSGTPGAGAAGTGTGTVVVPGAGQKVYVVDKADNTGYWGISKKVYGDGKHWAAIAKANPKVDATALKAGQQLLIPELPVEARRPAPAATGDGAAPSTPPATRSTRTTHTEPKARPGPKDVEDIGARPSFR